MSLNVKEWHWEITTRCNSNCLDCITRCGKARHHELSTVSAIRAVRVMSSLGCKHLMITGGEPLCCDCLLDVLTDCNKRGIKVSLLTNGILVTRELAKHYSRFVASMGISIDGSSATINDKVRGKGSFGKACRAVSLFSSLVPTSVYVVASSNNFTDLESVFELASFLGAKTIHVSEITLRGRAAENEQLFRLSGEQQLLLRKLAKEKTGMSEPITGCGINLSSLYVSSDGSVYPCSEVAIGQPHNTLGNIVSGGFRKRLSEKKRFFEKSSGLCCCYEVYAGNGFSFVLNTQDSCHFMEGRRQP